MVEKCKYPNILVELVDLRAACQSEEEFLIAVTNIIGRTAEALDKTKNFLDVIGVK